MSVLKHVFRLGHFSKRHKAVTSNLFFQITSPFSVTGIHSTHLVFFFRLGKALFLWKNTCVMDEAAFIGLREEFDLFGECL